MGGTLAVLLAECLLRDGHPDWDAWIRQVPSPWYREDLRQADPLAFHRSAVSLVHHGVNMLARVISLPLERKGYILGAHSDADTHETARRVAASKIPVVTVKDSGHAFSEDDPEGFGRAILQLI
ncbi:alpha/beta fold hydrolase [Archangium lipolyticum]|uniref:alpha/beta fold hydrolase n=1 Tax=Archangium lipolyticum TaxID=2970465 RepID=UPI002149BAE5|nr:hypothetical protein [Archangium lipolyticum]